MIKDRKEELIEIAKDIAINSGFKNLTIRNLAKKADISIGSIYNLFGTKDELILELIKYYWETSINRINNDYKNYDGDYINKLNLMYKDLKVVTDEFHRDWIKNLSHFNMSNKEVFTLTKAYLGYFKNIIRLIIEESYLFNDLDVDKLSEFILENLIASLQKRREDLGFFEEVLKKLA